MHFEEPGAGEGGCNDVRRTMGVNPVDESSSSARPLTAPDKSCKCVLLPRTVAVFVILFSQFRRGVVGGVGGDTSLVHATARLLLIALPRPTPETQGVRRTVPVPVRRVRLSAMGRFNSSISWLWSVIFLSVEKTR